MSKINVVLVGDPKSGKTQFIETVAALYSARVHKDENGKSQCEIKLEYEFEHKKEGIEYEFMETPSKSDEYEKRLEYYPNANVILIFFDVRQSSQITELTERWHLELDDLTDLNQIRLLIGTHTDQDGVQTFDPSSLTVLMESAAYQGANVTDRDQVYSLVQMISHEWFKEQAQIAKDANYCSIQ